MTEEKLIILTLTQKEAITLRTLIGGRPNTEKRTEGIYHKLNEIGLEVDPAYAQELLEKHSK